MVPEFLALKSISSK